MLHRLSNLLVALVALAFMASLLAPLPARADSGGGRSDAPAVRHTVSISTTQYKAVKYGVRAAKTAKGRTLDYRQARKVFGKKVSWRRQFAGGWLGGNSKLTHVSSAERKAIAREVRKHHGVAAQTINKKCMGWSGWKKPANQNYWNDWYYDSCRTNLIVRNLTWCVGSAGMLAGWIGSASAGTAAIISLLVFGCGAAIPWITTAQANSAVSAIIIRTGDVSTQLPKNPTPQNPRLYQVPVIIYPQ